MNEVDGDRDRVLVKQCQLGDSTAFENLYALYYDRVRGLCQRRLNDSHEAEDAAQEAFARVWRALPRFAGEQRFYPWLAVIATNVCTDIQRRSRSRPTDDLDSKSISSVTPEEAVLASVDGEIAGRALARLSTRQRRLIEMRDRSGWTYQQIATHEGVSVGTVESLLWRARQALRQQFVLLSDGKTRLAGFLVAVALLVHRGVRRLGRHGTGNPEWLHGTAAAAGLVATGAVIAVSLMPPASPGRTVKPRTLVTTVQPSVGPTSTIRESNTTPTAAATSPPPSTSSSPISATPRGAPSLPTGDPASVPPLPPTPESQDVPEVSTPPPPPPAPTPAPSATPPAAPVRGPEGAVAGVTQTLGNVVGGTVNGLTQTVNGTTAGLANTVTNLTQQTVSNTTQIVNSATGGLTNTLNGTIVGGATGALQSPLPTLQGKG